MKPISPVLPTKEGKRLPEMTFAEGQSQYENLPAIRFEDGTVLTRWKLTFWERLRVLLFGNVYLQLLTFNRALQPIVLQVDPPELTFK